MAEFELESNHEIFGHTCSTFTGGLRGQMQHFDEQADQSGGTDDDPSDNLGRRLEQKLQLGRLRGEAWGGGELPRGERKPHGTWSLLPRLLQDLPAATGTLVGCRKRGWRLVQWHLKPCEDEAFGQGHNHIGGKNQSTGDCSLVLLKRGPDCFASGEVVLEPFTHVQVELVARWVENPFEELHAEVSAFRPVVRFFENPPETTDDPSLLLHVHSAKDSTCICSVLSIQVWF